MTLLRIISKPLSPLYSVTQSMSEDLSSSNLSHNSARPMTTIQGHRIRTSACLGVFILHCQMVSRLLGFTDSSTPSCMRPYHTPVRRTCRTQQRRQGTCHTSRHKWSRRHHIRDILHLAWNKSRMHVKTLDISACVGVFHIRRNRTGNNIPHASGRTFRRIPHIPLNGQHTTSHCSRRTCRIYRRLRRTWSIYRLSRSRNKNNPCGMTVKMV